MVWTVNKKLNANNWWRLALDGFALTSTWGFENELLGKHKRKYFFAQTCEALKQTSNPLPIDVDKFCVLHVSFPSRAKHQLARTRPNIWRTFYDDNKVASIYLTLILSQKSLGSIHPNRVDDRLRNEWNFWVRLNGKLDIKWLEIKVNLIAKYFKVLPLFCPNFFVHKKSVDSSVVINPTEN